MEIGTIIGVIVIFVTLWAWFKPAESQAEKAVYSRKNRTANGIGEGVVVLIVLFIVSMFALSVIGGPPTYSDGNNNLTKPIMNFAWKGIDQLDAVNDGLHDYREALHAKNEAKQDAERAARAAVNGLCWDAALNTYTSAACGSQP